MERTLRSIEQQKTWLPGVAALGALLVGATGLVVASNETSRHTDNHVLVAEPTFSPTPEATAKTLTQPLRHGLLAPSPTALPQLTPSPNRVYVMPKPRVETPATPTPSPTPTLVHKSISYAYAAPRLAEWVQKLTDLQQLSADFPTDIKDAPAQLQRIHELDQQSPVTAEDLANFKINTDYIHAFDGTPGASDKITVHAFVMHWSVNHFTGGVKDFIAFMKGRGLSVEFFIDKDGTVYQLYEHDNRKPAHAKGANGFAQGAEIDALSVFTYTPAQIKAMKLLTATFLKRNHITPSPVSFFSHETIDMLFSSPFYDNETGRWHPAQGRPASIDKIDPPEELPLAMLDDIRSIS